MQASRPWYNSRVVLIALVVVAVISAPLQLAAQQLQDVVYLKDGSVIRGMIVEQRPGESILIKTRDGNTLRYTVDRIDRMTKEPASGLAVGGGLSHKSPTAAGVWSALIVGAGQGYNGEWGKAGLFLASAVVFGSATQSALNSDACLYEDDCGAAGVYAVAWLGTSIWSIVDAVQSAKRINRVIDGVDVARIRLEPVLGIERNTGAPNGATSKYTPRLGLRLVLR